MLGAEEGCPHWAVRQEGRLRLLCHPRCCRSCCSCTLRALTCIWKALTVVATWLQKNLTPFLLGESNFLAFADMGNAWKQDSRKLEKVQTETQKNFIIVIIVIKSYYVDHILWNLKEIFQRPQPWYPNVVDGKGSVHKVEPCSPASPCISSPVFVWDRDLLQMNISTQYLPSLEEWLYLMSEFQLCSQYILSWPLS